MKAGQAELIAALKATVWAKFPWSGDGACWGVVRAALGCKYMLESRYYYGRVVVAISDGSNDKRVASPEMALEVVEGWGRQHAERALVASGVADELRAMIGGAE